jgi:HAMP domain-containing protein
VRASKRAETAVGLEVLLEQPLDEPHRLAAPGDHLVDVLLQLVALGGREALVDAARDGARAVDALARGVADHFLAVLAQQHALLRDVGVLGRHADDVAAGDVGVEAEQQVGRGEVEEVQRVRLQDLPVVHQAADLLGRGRKLRRADHLVERLAGREVVAHRADAAQPLHHHRHFPVRPALDELLERAELDDVQARLLDVVVLVHQQRDLAVALDARQRLDHDSAQLLGVGGGLQRKRAHGCLCPFSRS